MNNRQTLRGLRALAWTQVRSLLLVFRNRRSAHNSGMSLIPVFPQSNSTLAPWKGVSE